MNENSNEREKISEIKIYDNPQDIEKKLLEIEEKIEIAQKQVTHRLCIPFTEEELKKVEIAFNYRYSFNKKSKITSYIKNNVMNEVEEILEDMKQNFFKE